MNRDRINHLADHLEQRVNDAGFDVSRFWFVAPRSGCVAGHAVALFGAPLEIQRRDALHLDGTFLWTPQYAAELLELDDDATEQLFFPPMDRYVSRQLAAQVLRHLAETGKVDWGKFYGGPTGEEL